MSLRRPRPELSRRLPVALVLLLTLVLGALSPAVGAQEPAEPPEPAPMASPRIVGGVRSAPGAWPSQAALVDAGNPLPGAQFCGATVISRSWMLTAAHCVTYEGSEDPVPTSSYEVLTGTQSLTAGSGTRHRIAEVRVLSGYDDFSFNRDVALIRIDSATTAPNQRIAAPGAEITGATATATGWGSTVSDGGRQTQLREVEVPVLSDQQCRTTAPSGFEPFGSEYIAASMLCAGGVDRDACQGDSGGPLVVGQGGTSVQYGITSWGVGCASGYPGVYSRVAAFSSWIRDQIRYGPLPDATAFVRQTYADLFNRLPTNSEQFYGVAALNGGTEPYTFARDLVQGDTYQRRTGGVTRLYRALFLRAPDTGGLTYWWDQANGKRSLQRIADIMASSGEFRARYGSLDDGQYVDRVYQNVLGRPPDARGRAFWVNELSSGRRSRGEVMVGFSESSEYKGDNKIAVDVIITFFGLVRRAPNDGELATWAPRPNVFLAASLLGSFSYASRF